jgi:hypothetical protein
VRRPRERGEVFLAMPRVHVARVALAAPLCRPRRAQRRRAAAAPPSRPVSHAARRAKCRRREPQEPHQRLMRRQGARRDAPQERRRCLCLLCGRAAERTSDGAAQVCCRAGRRCSSASGRCDAAACLLERCLCAGHLRAQRVLLQAAARRNAGCMARGPRRGRGRASAAAMRAAQHDSAALHTERLHAGALRDAAMAMG